MVIAKKIAKCQPIAKQPARRVNVCIWYNVKWLWTLLRTQRRHWTFTE